MVARSARPDLSCTGAVSDWGHKNLKVLYNYFQTFTQGLSNLIVEEWIIPAIWFGTVVLWEIENGDKKRQMEKRQT
jgi:hypothetical protein